MDNLYNLTPEQLQMAQNEIDPFADGAVQPFEDDPLIDEIANRELMRRQMQQQQLMDQQMMMNSLDAMTPEEQMMYFNR